MSRLDDILEYPGTFYMQDPDTGAFVPYDMNAGVALLKPEIKALMLQVIGDIGSYPVRYTVGDALYEQRQKVKEL